MYCYFNNRIISESKAGLNLRDLGVLRGFGVFDVLRTYNGKPFMLKEHFARLKNSAGVLDLKLPISANEFEARIFRLLKKNKLNPRTQPANGESGAVTVCRQRAEQSPYDGKEAVVRSVLTGGVASDGINGETKPTFFILLEPLPTLNKNLYKNGIKLITRDHLREFAQAKTTNYILAVLLQKKLKKEKAFEVLYVWQDKILECSTSNFFIFKGDTLITPKDNILIGITRNVAMQLAKEKFKIEERDIAKEELAFATEAFIAATNKEIIPVVRIDDFAVGNGRVGQNTQWLMNCFSRFVKNY